MYSYKIVNKGIFQRPFTGIAASKEEIEQATGMTITDGVWATVEKGKQGLIEDELFVLTIKKI